jgi:hypothetical protein
VIEPTQLNYLKGGTGIMRLRAKVWHTRVLPDSPQAWQMPIGIPSKPNLLKTAWMLNSLD